LLTRREWDDIFKMPKDKNGQPGILYPAKLSFRNEGETKTSIGKQEMLMGVLQIGPKYAN
jgi:hypothetical protein